MDRTGGMENAHDTLAPECTGPEARFPHRLGRHRTPPIRSTGTLVCTLEHDVTGRISSTRCETDGRKLTEQRRYAPTSVHVRRNPCSRSPDLVFTFTGLRKNSTERLGQAVDAYRAALEERTRERVPLEWAMTQNNLGSALRALGQRESGTELLEQAVDAHRAALEERTRERVPLEWATTQNNLGSALWILGERESGTDRLEQAVDAHRAALEEYTRARVPLTWAATQNDLGNALRSLGERERGTERLEQATDAYRAALDVFADEGLPRDRAIVQNNLTRTLKMLTERENSAFVGPQIRRPDHRISLRAVDRSDSDRVRSGPWYDSGPA